VIKEMLKLIDVPLEKLKFVVGTSYQLDRNYTLDMYKMSALATTEHTSKAGAEVVKQTEHPLMSSLLYPILQALDEEYLKVDVQFGGVDQRKIFMFARENLPKIGYKKRCHLMNTLIPGLTKSGKMSSSEPNSKLDLDDTDEIIKKKFGNAFSEDGKAEGNGMLCMLKFVLFRYLNKHNRPFVVPRAEDFGGPQTFHNYSEVESAFLKKELMSGDLKKGMITLLCEFLAPLRKVLQQHSDLEKAAYPPVSEAVAPPEGVEAAKPKSKKDLKKENYEKWAQQQQQGGGQQQPQDQQQQKPKKQQQQQQKKKG